MKNAKREPNLALLPMMSIRLATHLPKNSLWLNARTMMRNAKRERNPASSVMMITRSATHLPKRNRVPNAKVRELRFKRTQKESSLIQSALPLDGAVSHGNMPKMRETRSFSIQSTFLSTRISETHKLTSRTRRLIKALGR